MKSIFFSIILIVMTSGCQPVSENATNGEKTSEGKLFFDYDAIDYYFNDINEHASHELYDNHNTSADDSIRTNVILGFTPTDMNDLAFIDKLETFGYSKSSINPSAFKEINDLFSERTPGDAMLSACIYIYRDILIFKKNGKVVGTAKICFACGDSQIKGTTAYTGMFGQNGDYERLAKIVRPKH